MRLTKKDIERANQRRKYSDGRGLFLSVSKNGRKSWAFCYTMNGKAREMGLGSVDFMTIDQARDRAVQLRLMVKAGADPMEDRDRARAAIVRAKASGTSFRDVAESLIKKMKSGWSKNGKSEASWRGSFENHVYPVLGDRDVTRIDRYAVRDALLPIWHKVPVTAKRLIPRIEEVFDHAILEGWLVGENPAERRMIRKMLPPEKKEQKHQKALPYSKMQPFMKKLREYRISSPNELAPQALEFCILTCVRTGDVIGATWDEIDLEAKLWSIPISRMKAGRQKPTDRDHIVPLSDQAIAILKAVVREEGNPYVFPSPRNAGEGISNMTMLDFLKDKMGLAGEATVHGFRSSFRDWASEETDHDSNAAEMALAHTIPNKVEAAYRRGSLLEKRKALMQDWADYCEMEITSPNDGELA
ncbi:site-specific integrase [Sphingobium sp. BS19]|uniref:tyrosine-type recombinase/integrase n=1 Tax=Sphingobium sp. BS19 TaxID=3018973 RepID=UPI0022EDB000|nr:site-specific integrase [Sphingobium sp. BS19]GLJ00466.1 bacteriophage P4 integrase [Sphingobium sp. BS19]